MTVSTAVWVTPFEDAEIVTAVEAATALVEMANTALDAPSATVTLAGTLATLLLALDEATPSCRPRGRRPRG